MSIANYWEKLCFYVWWKYSEFCSFWFSGISSTPQQRLETSIQDQILALEALRDNREACLRVSKLHVSELKADIGREQKRCAALLAEFDATIAAKTKNLSNTKEALEAIQIY